MELNVCSLARRSPTTDVNGVKRALTLQYLVSVVNQSADATNSRMILGLKRCVLAQPPTLCCNFSPIENKKDFSTSYRTFISRIY